MMSTMELATSSPRINSHHLGFLDLRSIIQPVLASLIELGLHRGVATSEPLDGEVVGLVVGKAEVVL